MTVGAVVTLAFRFGRDCIADDVVEQRLDQTFIVGRALARLIRLFGRQSSAPGLAHQKMAHDQRLGRSPPRFLAGGSRMMRHLLGDLLGGDLVAIDGNDPESRQRLHRLVSSAAAMRFAGRGHRGFRARIGRCADVYDIEFACHHCTSSVIARSVAGPAV